MAKRCYLCKTAAIPWNNLVVATFHFSLWFVALDFINLSCMIANSTTDEIRFLHCISGDKRRKKLISLIPPATLWIIWKYRNMRAFEDTICSFDMLKDVVSDPMVRYQELSY